MFKRTVGILGLALALSGCGSAKKASAEESAAAAKVMGPMMSKEGSSAGGVGMSNNVTNIRALTHYLSSKIGTNDDADVCASITDTFNDDTTPGVTCKKNKCDFSQTAGTLSLDVACSSTKTVKFTCDSVDYTAKSIAYGVVMNTTSSALTISMTFGMNLTGGALTGTGDVACSVSASITASSKADDIGADNIKCTYDGKTLDSSVMSSSTTSTCTETDVTASLN